MEVLQKYEAASGQLINKEKSSVFFSKNKDSNQMKAICEVLGNMNHVNQGQYLGLPMVISKSKHQVFGFVKEKMRNRLQNWKGKFPSAAGKKVSNQL